MTSPVISEASFRIAAASGEPTFCSSWLESRVGAASASPGAAQRAAAANEVLRKIRRVVEPIVGSIFDSSRVYLSFQRPVHAWPLNPPLSSLPYNQSEPDVRTNTRRSPIHRRVLRPHAGVAGAAAPAALLAARRSAARNDLHHA